VATKFDPYHKWLGILVKNQPPHHYRLLGLELFEEDSQIIEGAADRQLSFLRKFQSGEHAAACQKLLNEVSRARLCLLKPAVKAAYDAELRNQLQSENQSAEANDPAQHAPSIEIAIHKSTGNFKRASRTQTYPLAVVACGVLLLLVVLGFLFLRGGENAKSEPHSDARQGKVAVKPGELSPEQGAVSKSNPGSKITETAVSNVTDILPLLQREHAVAGAWAMSPNALACIGNENLARVVLPVPIPAEYTIKVQGKRAAVPGGSQKVIGVGIACGLSDCLACVHVDPTSDGGSGLHELDRHPWSDNESTLPHIRIPDGTAFTLEVTVRKSNIDVSLNGRQVIDWYGDFSRLHMDPNWQVPQPYRLFLACQAQVRFTKLTIGPPMPRLDLPGHDLKVNERAELLKFVDLKKDVWHGTWLQEGPGVFKSNPAEDAMRLSVPFEVPDEYQLEADVESYTEIRECYFGLPFQQGYVQMSVGGGNNDINGVLLDSVWNWEYPGLTDKRAQLMQAGHNRILAIIRNQHFILKVNEQLVVDWKGDPLRLSKMARWSVPGKRIALGSWSTGQRFHSLKLTRLTASPPPFPAPPQPTNGDLLAIVDADRDARLGLWSKVNGVLACTRPVISGILVPFQLPADYEFRVVVERVENPDAFELVVPVAGKPVSICLDSDLGAFAGIEWMNGRVNADNSTKIKLTKPLLPPGESKVITGQVTGNHLRVEIDGEKLLALDIPEVIPDPYWQLRPFWITPAERPQMYLGSWHSSLKIHEIRYRGLGKDSPPFPKR
jgi:hypothetical protein